MDPGTRQVVDSVIGALEGGRLAEARALGSALAQLACGDEALAAAAQATQEFTALAPRLAPAFARPLGGGLVCWLRGEALGSTHAALAEAVRANPGGATLFLASLQGAPQLHRRFGTDVSNALSDAAQDPSARGPLAGQVSVPAAAGGLVGGGALVVVLLRFALKASVIATRQQAHPFDRDESAFALAAAQEQVDVVERARERAQARARLAARHVPTVQFGEAPATFRARLDSYVLPEQVGRVRWVFARLDAAEVEALGLDVSLLSLRLLPGATADHGETPVICFGVDERGRERYDDEAGIHAWVVGWALDALPAQARFGWASDGYVEAPPAGPVVERLKQPLPVSPKSPATQGILALANLGPAPAPGETRWAVVLRYANVSEFANREITLASTRPVDSARPPLDFLPAGLEVGWLLDTAGQPVENLASGTPHPHQGTVALAFDLPQGLEPTRFRSQGDSLSVPRAVAASSLAPAVRAALLPKR